MIKEGKSEKDICEFVCVRVQVCVYLYFDVICVMCEFVFNIFTSLLS